MPRSTTTAPLRYMARKRRRIAQLRRIVVASYLLVVAALGAVFARLPPQWQEAALPFLKRGAQAHERAQAAGMLDLWPLLLLASSLSGGFVLAWKLRIRMADWLFEHCFDSFHDDLFEPVRRPAPTADGQPPMPWIAPTAHDAAPERQRLWQALAAWVRQGADQQAANALPMSWALLVGRPGAGKSRMADEFGRGLARRLLLGDAAADKPQARRLRLGAWWRRARRRPADTDPWDVGRPAHRSASGTALLQDNQEYRSMLAAWRPRAPTLILFEDPRAGEAAALIESLTRQGDQAAFQFPVRLMVINQTLPLDLKLAPAPGLGSAWSSDLANMVAGPWIVHEAAYLTWNEWVEIKSARFARDDRRLLDLDRTRFHAVTRDGNPLLVESLVHWLEACAPGHLPRWDGVTPDTLLRDRAERVLRALAAAGIVEHRQLQLLAAATVVGGLAVASVQTACDAAGLDTAALQRVFPEASVQGVVPGVRPDLVGLAFVDRLIRTPTGDGVLGEADAPTQRATAAAIGRLAWQADPYGVLAAMARLADLRRRDGQAEAGSARRLLWDALVAPPADLGQPPLVLARAFVRFQIQYGGAMEACLARLRQLPQADAAAIAETDVLEALQRDGAHTRDAAVIFAEAMERALQGGEVEAQLAVRLADAVVALAPALRRRGMEVLDGGLVPSAGFRSLGQRLARDAETPTHPGAASAATGRVRACMRAMWRSPLRRHGLSAFARGVAVGQQAVPVDRALGLEAACLADALEGQLPAARVHASALASMSVIPPGDPNMAEIGAAAWAYIALGEAIAGLPDSASRARECAEAIGRIREPFGELPVADRRKLAEWHADAWVRAAYAHSEARASDSASRVRECADAIGRICKPFGELPVADRRKLAERHADAWVRAAYAHIEARTPDSATRARECADAIARIRESIGELPLADRRELAESHAYAWMAAAQAHSDARTPNSADRARECVDAITRIRESFGELPLAERRELAERHAYAWARTAYAHSKALTPDSAAEARECADAIARIREPLSELPLAERRLLADWHADAWARAAYAHSEARTPDSAAKARECADAIARIRGPLSELPLAERRVLAEWHALAWARTAYARSEARTSDSAALAQECADAIARLREPFGALPLADRRQLAEWHSAAWVRVAEATSRSHQPDSAHLVERCAETIAGIRLAFAALPASDGAELDRYLAFAWCCAARTYDGAGDAAAAGRCAARAHAVADPWRGIHAWAHEYVDGLPPS